MSKVPSIKTKTDRQYNPIEQKPKPNDFLLNILENGNATIELISVYSKMGFIFKLSYNGKSYIMKIVVLSDSKYLLSKCTQMVESLKDKKSYKVTQIENDFVYESEIQNFINNQSKRGGRTPICPEVIYAKIYDNRLSQHFLSLLKNNNTEINSVFECLQYYFNQRFRDDQDNNNKPHFKLGIILMSEIENGIVFANVSVNNNNSIIVDNHIYSQIIYLFLIIGIINFDMHPGNALVSGLETGNIETQLIDFGESVYLDNNVDDSYLYASEKIYINEIRQDLKKELDNIVFPKKTTTITTITTIEEAKINFIMKTMNIINLLAWIVNQRKRNYKDVLEHQMDWFVPVGIVTIFMKTSIYIFKKKEATINSATINSATINSKNLGNIITNLMNNEFVANNSYLKAFELLENIYKTKNTRNNTYRNEPVTVLTFDNYNKNIKNTIVDTGVWIDNNVQSVQSKKCEGNENDDATCAISGGRKKSTKKNITRKCIRKPIRKSQKKIIRKSKKI
jgi:hypothetical protein